MDTIILKESEVESLLNGKQAEIIKCVADAYLRHHQGLSSLPHSSFLKFPGNPNNRIIALPAHLGGPNPVTGIKWIASFPSNLEIGAKRASATLILNCEKTGAPIAICSAATISAKRTAASAALAAKHLSKDSPKNLGIIGCGIISREIFSFLIDQFPEIKTVFTFDVDSKRAELFKNIITSDYPDIKIFNQESSEEVLSASEITVLATTASKPHITSLNKSKSKLILHISLRDLSPTIIRESYNVVDDIEHVSRAHTSFHLASEEFGVKNLDHCDLASILLSPLNPALVKSRPIIFSPFGLGVLDLALGKLVLELAAERNIGLKMPDFL